MAAKEMTVRACRDGGFVVYDRIQMVQNPEPLAGFSGLDEALHFVLCQMLPEDAARLRGLRQNRSPGLQEKHLREVEEAVRAGAGSPGFASGLFETVPAGRLVPRDEPLMEDDWS